MLSCFASEPASTVILREPEGRVELFVVEARSAEHQKAPQAGSHKSLIFPVKGKELFYHKGCKFAFVGVEQIRRRSLRGASTPWFPLFIAGALQLRKLRLALRAPSG